MNCADVEILLCDYLDGTLASDARAELERHLAECPACTEMARDVSAAVSFIERAAEVEPPPELLTRILFELPSAHQARARQSGFRELLHKWVQPILQPRFAMGFAMTILSFSLLARFAGISVRQLTLDDLRPTKIWQALDDRVYRAWQRTVKFYENLRVVYEIQTQLRDWTQAEQEERKGRPAQDAPAALESRPQNSATPQPSEPGGSAPARPNAGKDLRNRK